MSDDRVERSLRPRNTRAARAIMALSLAISLAAIGLACGKKGPPLPPLAGMTPRVIDLEIRQAGRGARATFTLPMRPGTRLVDYETRGLELWRRPVEPRGTTPITAPRVQSFSSDDDQGPPPPPEVPLKDFTKGATLVAEIGGADLFDFLSLPTLQLVDPVLPEDVPADGLEYAVVLKTDIRSNGTVSNLAELQPLPAPDMPSSVKAEAIEGAVRVSWTAALAPPPAAKPEEKGMNATASDEPVTPPSPPGPAPVNIYRAVNGAAFGVEPIDGSPFGSSPFTDKDVASGTTYRYVLRSMVKSADDSVESDAAPEVSAEYRDVFAPATPKGLRVIPESGRVNLVWNPSSERDLAGYHVYRRPNGGTWERLDTAPLPSATFSDRSAPVGQPVEYAVTAYDRSTPPNESEKSAAVAVTAEAPE